MPLYSRSIEAKSYEEVSLLDGYDAIGYIGFLYVGGVQGLKKRSVN